MAKGFMPSPELQAELTRAMARVEALQVIRRAAGPRASDSFWLFRTHENFPPKKDVTRIADYQGGENLGLVITQTGLPAAEQKKLLREWCELLPTLGGVRHLWFHSKVTQEMLDAAAAMPALEGLYIKWSAIKSLERLPGCRTLKHLFIGGAPGVKSIEPLAHMTQLEWLETENLSGVSDFAKLSALTRLTGLGLTGSMWTRQPVKSLEPLAALTSLRWLAVSKSADESLRPLAALKALRWLGISSAYPLEEFAWLAARLPQVQCRCFQPFDDWSQTGLNCRKCAGATLVSLIGKGGRTLCRRCDAAKVAAHVEKFEALLVDARSHLRR